MKKPILEFLPNLASEKEGLGDAGIETFRDTPYASCAREAGQNSLDAFTKYPVSMRFNVLKISHEDFPSYSVLKKAIKACKEEATQERDKAFFKNAEKVINKSCIPVLEISDGNTTGLTGPPEKSETPFHSLVKARGVTAKSNMDAGGSFGIGKSASFAVSDLQTVFYSTIYKDQETGREAFAAQGRVRLVSHTGSDGESRRSIGYWGNPEGYSAVKDNSLIPDWMNRKDIGTTIFCMGFRESEDWAERMTYSLVSNFFCAIHREKMVFEVDSKKYVINSNTLEHLLDKDEIKNAAENIGHEYDLKFSGHLYRCLVSDRAEEKTISIASNLGRIRVRILVEEGMPRKIGFIRNGMLITDDLRHFACPLVNFPGSRDFVALVEPEDKDAGVLLKQLENPSHDGFSAERIPDPKKRQLIYKAMVRLGKDIRKTIRSKTNVKQEGSVDLDELEEFFVQPGPSGSKQNSTDETNPEKYTYESQDRSREQRGSTPTEGNQGGRNPIGEGPSGGSGEGPSGGSGGETGGGSGGGTGKGTGGKGVRGNKKAIQLLDVRNLICKDDNGYPVSRNLHFTPGTGGKILLSVKATGINNVDNLKIIEASIGVPVCEGLSIDVSNGKRCSVKVVFDEPYGGPIELLAIKIDTDIKEK